MGKKQNLIDNNLYNEMWNFAHTTFVTHGMKRREISDYFDNYSLKLPFLFRPVLGCSKIGIRLTSFESKRVAAASITKMEKPEGSSYFCNFAFFARPSADLKAPILDCDALDPMIGVKGMFVMNLYNCNQADFDIDEFFGDTISKIKEALEIVEPFKKTPEQGRGKYTSYLEPYLSKYCIELAQPDARDVEALKKFYQSELAAFKLYLEAYLSSLLRLTPEKSIFENNKSAFDKFIGVVLENDFAAKTGKKILKDDFQKYYHEGCWHTGYYGENIAR